MEILIVLVAVWPVSRLATIPLQKIFGDELERSVINTLAFALGIGILALLLFFLGLFDLLKAPVVWNILILLFLSALFYSFKNKTLFDTKSCLTSFKLDSSVNRALLVFAFILFLFNVLGAYIPQTGDDALYYHFALPKLFIRHGGIYHVTDNFTSVWPFNIEMLFSLGLLLGNETTANLFNVIISAGFAVLIYHLIKLYLGHSAGVLWSVITYSTPLTLAQMNKGFVDMGTGLFALSGLYLMLKMIHEKKWAVKTVTLAGIFFGLAAGTKIVGALTGVLAALAFAAVYFRELRGKALGLAALLVLLTGLIASPWTIRSFVLTGNPVYPVFTSLFSSGGWDQKVETRTLKLTDSSDIALAPMGRSLRNTALIPVYLHYPQMVISWLHRDHPSVRTARPDLSYLTFLFLPFALLFLRKEKQHRQEALFMGLILSLFMLAWYFCLTQVGRYLLPVLGLLTLFSAFGLSFILAHPKLIWLQRSSRASIAFWFLGVMGIYGAYYAPKAYGLFHREQYLLDYGYFRPMVNWVNTHLGPQDKIALLSEIGPYVFDVPYTHPGPGFHLYDFQDAPSLHAFLAREKVTHLFVARDSAGNFLDEHGTVNVAIYLFRQDDANSALADLLRDATKTTVVYSQQHAPVIGKSPLVLGPPIQVTVYRLLN